MNTGKIGKAAANVQLLTDYFASWEKGGEEGIAGIEAYYSPNITVHHAGKSIVSGEFKGLEDLHKRYFMKIHEMTDGRQQLVGRPVILAAGDRFVLTVVYESHQIKGKEPLVVERFVMYEMDNRKIVHIRAYEFDQEAFDNYYAA